MTKLSTSSATHHFLQPAYPRRRSADEALVKAINRFLRRQRQFLSVHSVKDRGARTIERRYYLIKRGRVTRTFVGIEQLIAYFPLFAHLQFTPAVRR